MSEMLFGEFKEIKMSFCVLVSSLAGTGGHANSVPLEPGAH